MTQCEDMCRSSNLLAPQMPGYALAVQTRVLANADYSLNAQPCGGTQVLI